MRKVKITVYVFFAFALAAALALQILPASTSVAQAGSPEASEKPACDEKDWTAWHEQKVAERAEMDARLDELVGKMDAATGDEKVEAMAAVIAELVAQRKEMHERKAKWHAHTGCAKGAECGGCPKRAACGAAAGSDEAAANTE